MADTLAEGEPTKDTLQEGEPTKKSAFVAELKKIDKEAKDRGYRRTRDFIADEVGVVKSAVSAWFSGVQVPRPKHLDALAKIFSLGDEELRNTYRNRLFDAAGIPNDQGGTRTALMRARERIGVIRIGVARYDKPFEDFFSAVLRSFAGFSAFYSEIELVRYEEMVNRIDQGKTDVGGNFFATPDRAQRLRFIDIPITIGANALTFSVGADEIPRGQNGALIITNRTVRPIVTEADIGDLFVRYGLGFNSLDIIRCDYRVERFADELMTRFAQWLDQKQEKPPIPIIVVDEWFCLKVHLELVKRTMEGKRLSQKWTFKDAGVAKLLLGSLKEKYVIRRFDDAVAVNPTFNLTICVKRDERDKEWFDYINTAWHIFLHGNSEIIEDNYITLYKRLVEPLNILGANIEAHPGKFADNFKLTSTLGALKNDLVDDWKGYVSKWMRFDRPGLLPDPWNRIVSESARKLEINQSTVEQLYTELEFKIRDLAAALSLRRKLGEGLGEGNGR